MTVQIVFSSERVGLASGHKALVESLGIVACVTVAFHVLTSLESLAFAALVDAALHGTGVFIPLNVIDNSVDGIQLRLTGGPIASLSLWPSAGLSTRILGPRRS